ncbi:hypothetical protein [Umezawaea sp. NPDC059074]|uniref:hypothetical protein n=1 Tax=Umezawaea sp. NPDC059074 TaxID=3346716 RepID=UPI0036CD1DE5
MDNEQAQAALAHEFEAELYEGYRFLARTINYRAKQFLDMVTVHRGVGAAQILLRGPNASDGFTRLWQERMLAHSLEAVVLKPKYGQLFTAEELLTARYRLEQHGFDVEDYLSSQTA